MFARINIPTCMSRHKIEFQIEVNLKFDAHHLDLNLWYFCWFLKNFITCSVKRSIPNFHYYFIHIFLNTFYLYFQFISFSFSYTTSHLGCSRTYHETDLLIVVIDFSWCYNDILMEIYRNQYHDIIILENMIYPK